MTDHDDILDRLQKRALQFEFPGPLERLCQEAAEEINRWRLDAPAQANVMLSEENDRLIDQVKSEGETLYGAYLGLCVLHTMCKKAGLAMAEQRSEELLAEIGQAHPEFAGRTALREV